MDIQNIDIAHYTGHKAIEELAMAHRIYATPIADVLAMECVHVTSFDFKPKHDIEDLARRTRVSDLDLDSVDPINAFHWGGYLRHLRKKEGERCINAAIFFQAMMEAVINDHMGDAAEKLYFAQKWRSFLTKHDAPARIKQAFEEYVENIYRSIRIKALHAKSRTGGLDTDSLRFPFVHGYLKSGWDCFVFLYGIAHDLDMDYDKNWKAMCDIHRIPSMLDTAEFCDIGELSRMMTQKHLDSFNQDHEAVS